MALILMGLAEANGASPWAVHGLGALLLAARAIHPFGLDWDRPTPPARVFGAVSTSFVVFAASILCIYHFFTS